MAAWQLWCIAAVLLLVVEMFTRRFWFLCIAIGAALAGVVGMASTAGVGIQLASFVVGTLVSLRLVRH